VKVDNGRLCGGYCSIGWKSSGYYQIDKNSFVFSLDSLKKYSESKQGHGGHVSWGSEYGPWHGYGGSLGFNSPMNQDKNCYCIINAQSLTVPGDSQG
jgi:hypothetical protein